MPIAPRIITSDDVYRLATWQNVTIAVFAGDVDTVRIMRIARAHRELAIEYPKGIVAFTIVRPGVPIASQGARDEAAKFIKELGGVLQRSALVLEDTGIMAQVLRTVVRGINIVTRNPKLVLCTELDDAIRSLTPLVAPPQPGSDVRAELAAAVAKVRKGYEPQPFQQPAQR